MEIICKKVMKDSSIKSSYMRNVDFVTSYPESPSIPQLGDGWKYEPCFLPQKYENYAEQIQNFEIRPDDVFNLTFPKSGSNWSQEMIWLLNNNLDYETAGRKNLSDRFSMMEVDICFDQFTINNLGKLKEASSPRHIKSHLPAGLLPKKIWTIKPKIIYTARSIKDTAISYYHHYAKYHNYKGDMTDFLEAFLDDKIIFSPQLHHIRDFWSMQEEENILFVTYEEMKKDLMSVLKKTASFLGKNYSDEELSVLEKHLSFESMKSNPRTNYSSEDERVEAALNIKLTEDQKKMRFIRKGIVGSHKEEMPLEFIKRFDEKTDEFNRLNGTKICP